MLKEIIAFAGPEGSHHRYFISKRVQSCSCSIEISDAYVYIYICVALRQVICACSIVHYY